MIEITADWVNRIGLILDAAGAAMIFLFWTGPFIAHSMYDGLKWERVPVYRLPRYNILGSLGFLTLTLGFLLQLWATWL